MPVTVYDTTGSPAENLVTLVVRLPADLDAALRARAAREDRQLAQVVRLALRSYLDV